MPREDMILFLDCEMTGNADDDEIIEIGIVALDASSLAEVNHINCIIRPSDEKYQRMTENKVVSKMHTENGLIPRCLDAFNAGLIDGVLVRWLDGVTGGSKTHVPYGGSGVSHFDRKYITREFPRFDKRITYWSYDVGVVRRMFQLAGKPWLTMEPKSHRAIEDARQHADEFRYIMGVLKGL